MATSVARALIGPLSATLALLAGATLYAFAQDPPATRLVPPVAVPDVPSAAAAVNNDLSPQCDAPNADIATAAPLPNVAGLLEGNKKVRILAIGSSSTWGIGASVRGKAYPAQLEQILEKTLSGVEVKIINRGVSGEIASTTADRLKAEVALTHPNLVLWQLGTNDALAHVAPEDFEATVRNAVVRLKKRKIDVVLVGLQYTPRFARDANYSAMREALRRVAASENVLYVRRYDAMQFIAKTRANLEMMSGDDFHLNDLGYQCMAEHVAHAVIANLFIRRRPDSQAKSN
jgi:acyl-CoA thioesterase-1